MAGAVKADRRYRQPISAAAKLSALASTILIYAFVVSMGLLADPAAVPAANSARATHVYLLRGVFNVFSLGMDSLREELARRGISASVNNHLLWSSLANEAAENYKAGRLRTIIVIGHSAGADAAAAFVERLGQLQVPVALAVALDGSSHTLTSAHVGKFVNLYTSKGLGGTYKKGPGFSGTIINVDLAKDPQVGHFNIDKLPYVHQKIVRYITESMAHEPANDTACSEGCRNVRHADTGYSRTPGAPEKPKQ